MIIKSIHLNNYRNYKDMEIHFDDGINILYGKNAQGKTNILESAYLCATTKSHKGSKDKEMIRFGCEESHIRTIVEKKQKTFQIDMHLKKSGAKGVAINKMPIKRAVDLFGIINIVFFSPEDLNIIKNGPAERRRFIDAELCQIDKVYLSDLTNYNKVLNQRNHLLKEMNYRPDLKETLPIWEEKLIEFGKKIIQRRTLFINDLNEIICGIHKNITGSKEHIVMRYEPSVTDNDFEKQLNVAKEKDYRFCSTSVGPHRDDMIFEVDGIDIRKFGSQGQQRTAALSLKLSEIEFVKKTIHDNPILLLDDVLSELDSDRQNYLLNSISDIQTIITCTGLDEFVKNRFKVDKVFEVVEGEVFDERRKENESGIWCGSNPDT